MTTKLLVTGSRDWTGSTSIFQEIGAFFIRCPGDLLIIRGDCPRGADWITGKWVESMIRQGMPVSERVFRADWGAHGKAAGPIRNGEMVKYGADACFAFIKDNSRGASDCATRAENAGIRTWRFIA